MPHFLKIALGSKFLLQENLGKVYANFTWQKTALSDSKMKKSSPCPIPFFSSECHPLRRLSIWCVFMAKNMKFSMWLTARISKPFATGTPKKIFSCSADPLPAQVCRGISRGNPRGNRRGGKRYLRSAVQRAVCSRGELCK